MDAVQDMCEDEPVNRVIMKEDGVLIINSPKSMFQMTEQEISRLQSQIDVYYYEKN